MYLQPEKGTHIVSYNQDRFKSGMVYPFKIYAALSNLTMKW